ncbi:MAG: isochorismatase family protein [Cutibacterium avidum]|uniref:nicotinamidase n=1 Tax=Cutibacterium avidum TaxID=33010 RepID=A0A3E2DCQ4_9ACTN|nr:isochorismatase family protein [Cutibacterium avidum]MDU2071595.1 isochorismatase family protein [Cutibacterium avidum]MDU3282890.1 isochorismatase family protein [Cutibacterium avidum]MDU3749796.1 isochorismatase family protein [Cutibacterium avidum]MDU7716659.1 isochorismatase family protein [Cutibacterium avidum]RFT43182.1 nicotinamidase [Cutibacterium avidum]
MTSSSPVTGSRSRRALIVVDVQPTFCEGGALPVEGGNDCARRIAAYLGTSRDRYDMVVTTQDWHIAPGSHFSPTPDFVDTWPPHGVAGSDEAQIHPLLADVLVDARVRKGQYAAAYSGFEGTTEDDVGLEQLLRDAGITAVDVVGLALSHCVKDTALDAVRLGFATRCLTDLSEPVSPELGDAAVSAMRQAGVEVTTSA